LRLRAHLSVGGYALKKMAMVEHTISFIKTHATVKRSVIL